MPNPLVIEVKWKLDCHVKLIFILLQTPKHKLLAHQLDIFGI